MTENSQLLDNIVAYCLRKGIAESTFGFRAVNDGKLVARLRGGKTITLPTYRQIERLLSEPTNPEPAE